ncbi:helix-turn-helix domain-containing protein [Arcobacter lanthieri]|uniref:helix-turn-helix domain-containing protein n=1 Tax=Aliarcobacter lanthieri TaxID=1355374 RepID=UPI001920C860|nr:helix-turn-helix domain-containing protein [Aliarcobacter lanthieri]MBL3518888.1 helix-turn-helix domain-containing protein [Aliarcobacter lanthieri]
MNEKMLTKEELAVRLNISAYDVDKLRKKQNMPSIKIGRGYRYDLENVLNFIKTLSTGKENNITQ